jgi:hypothetical protein
MTAANKWYSYPRVTEFRNDVHPAGKTRPIHHTHPTLSSRMVPYHTYLTRSMHSNLSWSHQQICTDPLPWEEGLLTQSTARQSSDPRVRTQLLSHNSQWGSGEKTSFCWQPTTRLTRPITLACDRYVQYLLTGVNPSVLNQHRRGL